MQSPRTAKSVCK